MTDRPSFCQYCGTPIQSEAIFCPHCGNRIQNIVEPAIQSGSGTPIRVPPLPTPPQMIPPVVPQYIAHSTEQYPKKPKGSAIKVFFFSLLGLAVVILLVMMVILVRNLQKPIDSESNSTPEVLIVTSTPFPINSIDPEYSKPTVSAENFFDYGTESTPTGEPVYETKPAPDWDSMAKSFITVDLDQCYFVITGNYYMEGTVTNTSTEYAVENVWLKGDLISSEGNLLTSTGGYPDALMLQPGTSASFWIWANYREVNNPTCDVYVESAEIAP